MLLELARLLLGLGEQFLGPDVAGEDVEAHAYERKQLVEESALGTREGPERRELENAEQLVL